MMGKQKGVIVVVVKELRQKSGMSRREFCEFFKVPYGTLQKWELELRKCPQYVLELMEYKLRNENLIE